MKTITLNDSQLDIISRSLISQMTNNNKAISLVSSDSIGNSIREENEKIASLLEIILKEKKNK